MDASKYPKITKHYLDLVVLYVSHLILLSRIDQRRMILWLVTRIGGPVPSQLAALIEFLGSTDLTQRPLILAYAAFKKFRETLKRSFLSSICLAFVAQRASCEQWRNEQFLTVFPGDSIETETK